MLYRQSDRPLICNAFRATLSIDLCLFMFINSFLVFSPYFSHVLYLLSKALHGLVKCKVVFLCFFIAKRERRHLGYILLAESSHCQTFLMSFLVTYESNVAVLHFIRPYWLCSISVHQCCVWVRACTRWKEGMCLFVATCLNMSASDWMRKWVLVICHLCLCFV